MAIFMAMYLIIPVPYYGGQVLEYNIYFMAIFMDKAHQKYKTERATPLNFTVVSERTLVCAICACTSNRQYNNFDFAMLNMHFWTCNLIIIKLRW